MRTRVVAAAVVLLLLAAVAVRAQHNPPAAPADPADRQLEDLRAKLAAEQKALAELMKKRGGVLDKMEAVRAQLARSAARVERLRKDQAIAAAESKELADRMAAAEKSVADRRRDLAGRLRARYQFGRRGLLRLWLEAKDLSDLSRRRRYLDALFRADATRIEEYKKLLVEWTAARKKLEERQRTMAGIEAVVSEQQKAMEAERQMLTALLKSVEEERAAHESMVAELKARESSLRGVLAGLAREVEDTEEPPVEGAVDFASLAGSLCLPARGPVTSTYGQKVHPKFGTVIMQNGIEIGAAAGSPAKAVAPGAVRFADWFRGYGNLVIIDHGGGWYTLYAHLASVSVSVGQQVGKGKTVGVVGDTGSMTGANLYFEVRHRQQPQDPAAWLGSCSL